MMALTLQLVSSNLLKEVQQARSACPLTAHDNRCLSKFCLQCVATLVSVPMSCMQNSLLEYPVTPGAGLHITMRVIQNACRAATHIMTSSATTFDESW